MSGLSASVDRGVLHISFHRASAGNSFGVEEARDLLKILKTHRNVRGLVWTSAHPSLFCAGGDLKVHASLKTKAVGLAQGVLIGRALRALREFPVPKMALVNGDCLGGGMELLSCFDHRVASPYVLFGFWQRRIALSFGWGGFARWSARVSPDVVKDVAFTARVFGASEALRLGFIQEIASSSSWMEQTLKWSEASGLALSTLTEKNETKIFASLWWSKDHRAVLKKFLR